WDKVRKWPVKLVWGRGNSWQQCKAAFSQHAALSLAMKCKGERCLQANSVARSLENKKETVSYRGYVRVGQWDCIVACVIVVGVRFGPGQGSGVIVSADGTILTAGHVSGTPNRNGIIIFPSGKQLKAKALGQNTGIDSGMAKIAQEATFPFLEMGTSADLKK